MDPQVIAPSNASSLTSAGPICLVARSIYLVVVEKRRSPSWGMSLAERTYRSTASGLARIAVGLELDSMEKLCHR